MRSSIASSSVSKRPIPPKLLKPGFCADGLIWYDGGLTGHGRTNELDL
jgi:hypothetical protein